MFAAGSNLVTIDKHDFCSPPTQMAKILSRVVSSERYFMMFNHLCYRDKSKPLNKHTVKIKRATFLQIMASKKVEIWVHNHHMYYIFSDKLLQSICLPVCKQLCWKANTACSTVGKIQFTIMLKMKKKKLICFFFCFPHQNVSSQLDLLPQKTYWWLSVADVEQSIDYINKS